MNTHSLNHPDVGAWRAWLDGEIPPSAPCAPGDLATHLERCTACNQAVRDLRGGRAYATAALEGLAPAPLPSAAAIALARTRLHRERQGAVEAPVPLPILAIRHPEQHPMSIISQLQRWRVAASGVAAALVLTLFVGFTPQGQTAAAQFLAQFRGQRFTVVTVTPASLSQNLLELDKLGSVQTAAGTTAPRPAASVAEAARRAGFALKQPDPATLPGGVQKTPTIQVSQASELRFTFSKAKARAYFDSLGRPEVALPDRFDGASLVVSIPAGVLFTYPSISATAQPTAPASAAAQDHPDGMAAAFDTGAGAPLLVGQAQELTVGVDSSNGVSLEELRTFLLGLPGVPPELASQLRAIQDWRSTLPIPVPVDTVSWQQTAIGGGQGLLLADNSGLGSGALWQRDGRIYGIAGALKAEEIRRVADGLK